MFKWFKKLWRSYTVEPPLPNPQYEVTINNTQFPDQVVAEAFTTPTVVQGTGTETITEMHQRIFGDTPQQNYGIGGYAQQIQIPIDYGQQQLGQQQMAAQQAMYMDGTYGAMQQQRAMFGQNGLLGNTYDSFLIELKANGMPEPDIKSGDLLGVEKSYLVPMINKLETIAGSSNVNNRKYGKMYEIVCGMKVHDKTKFKGDWGYDETLGEYIIQTSYCTQHLPLGIFMKLPQTIKECMEVMEKTLWSSRKLPITKKDIL